MLRPRSFRIRSSSASAALLVVGVVLTAGAEPGPDRGVSEVSSDFQQIDRLADEQKYEAAASVAADLRESAREEGDGERWSRALVAETQLRMALGGLEAGVALLREAGLPDQPAVEVSPTRGAVLELFYAQSLQRYLDFYSWEIRGRERVASALEGPLDTWTEKQILGEVHRSYRRVWQRRRDWRETTLGELSDVFEPNNYPGRIRGTLRDAVVYLWAEVLANSSYWTAAESNGVFRLEPGDLLGGAAAPRAMDPADLTAHPLEHLAVLLLDHESWHRSGGRPEASFEARRALVGFLRQAFSREEDRQVLAADLARATEELGRGFEWWSMGVADLASWRAEENEPQSQVEARSRALEGWRAHPESPGGERCRALVSRIEAPEYDVEAMASDAPGRRSILVQHRNVPRLWFRAWRVDPEDEIARSRERQPLPDSRRAQQLLSSRRADATWDAELPETSDYRAHRTFVTPPIEQPGLYVVVASASSHFGQEDNQLRGFDLVLGDLVLVERSVPGGVEVEALSGASGDPVEGAEVHVYVPDYRRQTRRLQSGRTDEEGVVRFSFDSDELYFLLARKDDQVAIDPRLRRGGRDREEEAEEQSLLYTDRSVYRPEQRLLWKVVHYRGVSGEGRFEVATKVDLTVELVDPNGETVATAETTTNEFGTASGEFEIPGGRLLGHWALRTRSGQTGLRVEEYKRPTFEVTLEEPAAALRLNRPATLQGEARYYFGLPVVAGEVDWRVTREPVFPRWWFWTPPAATELIAAGREALDGEGRFEVAFTPEADEREADQEGLSYRYRLEVDVTGEGGETRSATRSFRLGFVAVEASVELEERFFLEGEPAWLKLERRDLDGSPRPGSGSYEIFSLKRPDDVLLPADMPRRLELGEGALVTEGDRLRARWESQLDPAEVLRTWDDAERLGGEGVEHGEDGVARVEMLELAPGAYRLRYSTRDEFGAEAEAQTEFLVVGNEPLQLPLAGLLLAQKSSVEAGDSVRILVHSGLPDQRMVLETYRSGRRLEQRVLESDGAVRLLEIAARPEHRGGLFFRWTALRDHQLLRLEEQVLIPWSDRRLELEFATFRDRFEPGSRERWRVTVRGEEGPLAAGSAELLAYMYDRSLDLFAPHEPADPLDRYPRTAWAGGLGHTLGTAPGLWLRSSFAGRAGVPTLRGDRFKLFDSYGVGGPGRRHLMRRMVAAPMPSSPVAMESLDAAVSMVQEDEAVLAEGSAMAEKRGGESAPPPEQPVELRSDFSETGFWEPHLLLGEDGSVAFEFEAPDSVTEWSVWVHALTSDLRAGSLQRKVQTVKELLVRPYLPRFLRAGDRAELRVVVNNAGERPLSGRLDFDLVEVEDESSRLEDFGLSQAEARGVPFEVLAGESAELAFEVTAPPRPEMFAVRVSARAEDVSDGERRPLPVLPSRIHLAQSRFAVLGSRLSEGGSDRKVLRFSDLAADDDPSRIDEQLVVTLDGQLFYGVLRALPYLVDYPYDCTEQILNRFVSTAVVSSLYDDYPLVGRMAKKLSARDTAFEAWDAADPNRRMALEETPWLGEARGGPREGELPEGYELVKVLDPTIAGATRDAALSDLEKAQTASGGFPWWPGGPPSPYMTIYLLQGFSRALEHGIEVPRPMVERAWEYLHGYYVDELVRLSIEEDRGWESVTQLNYALSSYPDPRWTGGVWTAAERERMLDFSFKHWRRHTPLLKAALALTLDRAGRGSDAKLVLDSIMDSARSDDQLGTYWAPEDRSWLWYNDTIETHAYILRALTELDPDDDRRHGLVQWLFLNKKLNHWKSTRATAEVLYALVHYLDHENALGVREEATVELGDWRRRFAFEPERYGPVVPHGEVLAGPEVEEGRANQIVVPGDEVDPSMADVIVEKATPGLLFASATWHFSTDRLPEEAEGDFFEVERRFFRRVLVGGEWTLEPLAEGARVEVGDQVEVELQLRTKHEAEYVHLRDPRGAGFEPESLASGYKWDLGIAWYEETRDSGTNFFFEHLPVGEYRFGYRLRAATAGTFRVAPATIQPMYAPEFNAYSSGAVVAVE